jgi:hypothetical protein
MHKIMFLFMQVHGHWVHLMRTQIILKFQKFKILNQRITKGKKVLFKYHMTNCLFWLDLELLTLDVRNNYENQVIHRILLNFFWASLILDQSMSEKQHSIQKINIKCCINYYSMNYSFYSDLNCVLFR